MKRILSILVSILVVASLFANIQIGIGTIREHPTLDLIRDGIIDELDENGLLDNIDIDFQSAEGDMNVAVTIAQKFVSENKDIIISITTPLSQACAAATTEIPLLFSAVTNPIGAGLIEHFGLNSGNIAGISDMTPVVTQLKLLKLLVPDAEKVGIIYNPGEDNSVTITEIAKEGAKQLDMEIIEIIGSTTGDMISSLNSLIDEVDAIYIGSDNTAASCIETIGNVIENNKIPMITANITMARSGGIAGFGFNPYKIGRLTGKQAIELINGTSINEIESKLMDVDALDLFINMDLADELGIEIPDELVQKANFIFLDGKEMERNDL